jgi:hypothetical protein
MQQRMFDTALRYLVAVGTLVSTCAMVACGDGASTQSVAATVGLTNATVVAVQTVAFVLPQGQLFDPSLAGAVTVTFNSPPQNTFTLVGTGGTAHRHGRGHLWLHEWRHGGVLYVYLPDHRGPPQRDRERHRPEL